MNRIHAIVICLSLAACQPLPSHPGSSPNPMPSKTVSPVQSSALPSFAPSPTSSASLIEPEFSSPPFSANGITITPFAGSRTRGYKDGPTLDAQFGNTIGKPCQDSRGNLYIPDRTYLRKLSVEGWVSTVAGTADAGFRDGPAHQAQFNFINSCAVDSKDNIYLADFSNLRVRKLSPDGIVSTFAGTGMPGYADGPADHASFQSVKNVLLDEKNNRLLVYVYNSLREIDLTTGIVKTVFEQRYQESPTGTFTGFKDGPLNRYLDTDSSLDLTLDPVTSTLYLLDRDNHGLRSFKDNVLFTLAGGARYRQYTDGQGKDAYFAQPNDLAFEPERKLIFMMDYSGIRLVSLDGRVRTLALPGQQGVDIFPINVILNGSQFLYLKSKNELLIIPGNSLEHTFKALFYKVTLPDGPLPELKL